MKDEVEEPVCWSCDGPLSADDPGVCAACYRDPETNNCTECGRHLAGIAYEYVCGRCIDYPTCGGAITAS